MENGPANLACLRAHFRPSFIGSNAKRFQLVNRMLSNASERPCPNHLGLKAARGKRVDRGAIEYDLPRARDATKTVCLIHHHAGCGKTPHYLPLKTHFGRSTGQPHLHLEGPSPESLHLLLASRNRVSDLQTRRSHSRYVIYSLCRFIGEAHDGITDHLVEGDVIFE